MQRIGKVMFLPSLSGRDDLSLKSSVDEESLEEEDTESMLGDTPLLNLPEAIENRLMEHQRIGVRWLHSLYLSGSGGILGDDMGLGKTFQVISLLAGLMNEESIKRVLIIAPVSVLPTWQRELTEYLLPHFSRAKVLLVNSDLTKKKRQVLLDNAFESSVAYTPKIVISSYQLVSIMIDDFAGRGKWDYVILDEGHTIKNTTTKTYKAMQELSSKHRLILTGTPIQNNLNEFWAIANWATKGKRFGTISSFKQDFTLPITAGQNPKATMEERQVAEIATRNLLSLTKPILLQRKKCEIPNNKTMQLPTKVELVVWSPLATSQRVLYEEFLHSRQFDTAVHRSTCPVEVINHLKTVCRHPLLIEALEANRRRRWEQAHSGPLVRNKSITNKQQHNLHRNESRSDKENEADSENEYKFEEEDDDIAALNDNMASMNIARDVATGWEEGGGDSEMLKSCPANATVFDVIGRHPHAVEMLRGSIKLRILLKLVHRLHYAGHRTLIFSQSRLMLDIIQHILAHYNFASVRIDGSVKSSERQRIIDEFNECEEDGCVGPSICLLTTKACGTGITLTGADRVIIYDPSWNPAEDRQAVDRAYRIGQSKPVVVYRLIMASSVEEKMYEKQVFKDGLRVVTESGTSSRYFSKDEAAELFTLGPVDKSVVMERLWKAAGAELKSFPDTRGDLPSVLGFSRHDTLYTEARPDSMSQGENPYAQFEDKNFQPSDSDDDEVPPSPCVRRVTATPSKRTIPSVPYSTSKTHYVPAVLLTSTLKANTKEIGSSTSTPLSHQRGSGNAQDPFDLITPPPQEHVKCEVAGEAGVDPEKYALLMSKKLYSSDKSTPNNYSHAKANVDESGVDPSFYATLMSNKIYSPLNSAGSESQLKQEITTNNAFDSPQHGEFTGFGSPNLWGESVPFRMSVMSMPDRMSVLTEPSMYGDVCDLPKEAANDGNADEFGDDCPVHDSELPLHTLQPNLGIVSPSRRKTLILTSDSEEEEDTHCTSAANLNQPSSKSKESPKKANDEIESVESTKQNYSSRRKTMILSDSDEECRQSSVTEEDLSHFMNFGEAVESVNGELLQRTKEISSSEHDNSFNNVDFDSSFLTRELLVNETCSLKEIDHSAEELCENCTEEFVTIALEKCHTGVLLKSEVWSEDEDEVGLDKFDEFAGVYITEDVDTTQILGEPVASETDNTPISEEVQSAGSTEHVDRPEPLPPSLVSRRDSAVSCISKYGEFDEDSAFGSVCPPDMEELPEHSTTARSGFLLSNLCEMGSMRRTLSVNSGNMLVPQRSSVLAASQCSEPATDDAKNSCCDLIGAVKFSDDQYLSPGHQVLSQATKDEEEYPQSAGITVRKQRAPRLSSYLEPDIFASPPWMGGSIFSPDVGISTEGCGRSVRSDIPVADDRVICSELSAKSEPVHLISEINPRDSINDTFCIEHNAANVDGELKNNISETKPVDETMEELNLQVQNMNIARSAAEVATPISKISFQTSKGVLSNIIVKAQSMSKKSHAMVDFGSDSESDSDATQSEMGDCEYEQLYPYTPEVNESKTIGDKSETESDSENSDTPAEYLNIQSIALPHGESSSPASPVYPEHADHLGSHQKHELAPQSLDDTIEEHSWSSNVSSSPVIYTAQQSSFDDLILDQSIAYSLNNSYHAPESIEPNTATVSRQNTLPKVWYEITADKLQILKSIKIEPLSEDDVTLFDRCVVLQKDLSLRTVPVIPMMRPVSILAQQERDQYNSILDQASRLEDVESAARLYCQALSICDEDPYLHVKLAWLLQELVK